MPERAQKRATPRSGKRPATGKAGSGGAAPTRRRLPAEEARERILAAAEQTLAEVGPEGLRLTELSVALGISHPAILHHFGSREELVGAVVVRAMTRLNGQLTAALEGHTGAGRDAIFDLIADYYGAAGHARLIAWLVLSHKTPRERPRAEPAARPLQRVIELAHALRVKAHPERTIDFDDSRFRSQLTAVALLGDAIFGDMIRLASGDAGGPEAARSFRRRLAKLLADTA